MDPTFFILKRSCPIVEFFISGVKCAVFDKKMTLKVMSKVKHKDKLIILYFFTTWNFPGIFAKIFGHVVYAEISHRDRNTYCRPDNAQIW